mmetsp:Transcript_52517/g.97238  ORF Transcript_52517/g.97238 Transcript_52517/m.97238 type:complete len:278 (-) Transcript_52517:39-872(-)
MKTLWRRQVLGTAFSRGASRGSHCSALLRSLARQTGENESLQMGQVRQTRWLRIGAAVTASATVVGAQGLRRWVHAEDGKGTTADSAVQIPTEGDGPAVVAFCLSSDEDNPYRCFSNFYKEMPPYEYRIKFGSKTGCTVLVEHAVKALHITKASVFGDESNFDEILLEPMAHKCKGLGRKCQNFNEEQWLKVVEDVAYEVVLQKFQASEELAEILLSTGNKIIAEANEDKLWGIGIPEDDPQVQNPEEWPGRNVLGKALMKARETLRQQRAAGTCKG